MRNPLVYILILNWNSADDTISCIESLKCLSYSNYKIAILDNGSTDNSRFILREKFPDYHYIQTGMNMGYGAGNNVGIRYALKKGANYIWIINPDVTVEKDSLDIMVKVMEENPGVGICGPRLAWGIEPNIFSIDGANIYPDKGYLIHFDKICNLSDTGSPGMVDVGCVIGCSMLLRSKLVLDIGLIREDFFMYHEELEYNFRARSKGWRTVICRRAKSRHYHSSGQNELLYRYYNVRNIIFLARIRKLYVVRTAASFLRSQDYCRLLKNGRLRTALIVILRDLKPILAGLLTPLAPSPKV